MNKRARGLASLVALAMLALGGTATAADVFPSKPIRVVVPYPAGGLVDIIARSVSEKISRDWNQPIVVESKPGADGNIGMAQVARSPADGYTWLVTGPAILTNPTIRPGSGWEPLRDFVCVGVLIWAQSVILVPPSLPVANMRELVDYAKAHPGELNFGNPGLGSSIDLRARKLFAATGMVVNQVGYKGQPPALVDLLGGRIQLGIVAPVLALAHIKEGTTKPLAVLSPQRLEQMPAIPTIAEAGFPDAEYVPWFGIYLPAATPPQIIARVHDAVNVALADPEVRERLARADIPGSPMTLEALAALMKRDYETLTALVKAEGAPAK